ncbi:hypothetical protein BC831DRAFT_551585 [Entophlyctis helioformis]|nr:hypothetical protein BC831DRAFT_551585 [Entophlyctis helioformis]
MAAGATPASGDTTESSATDAGSLSDASSAADGPAMPLPLLQAQIQPRPPSASPASPAGAASAAAAAAPVPRPVGSAPQRPGRRIFAAPSAAADAASGTAASDAGSDSDDSSDNDSNGNDNGGGGRADRPASPAAKTSSSIHTETPRASRPTSARSPSAPQDQQQQQQQQQYAPAPPKSRPLSAQSTASRSAAAPALVSSEPIVTGIDVDDADADVDADADAASRPAHSLADAHGPSAQPGPAAAAATDPFANPDQADDAAARPPHVLRHGDIIADQVEHDSPAPESAQLPGTGHEQRPKLSTDSSPDRSGYDPSIINNYADDDNASALRADTSIDSQPLANADAAAQPNQDQSPSLSPTAVMSGASSAANRFRGASDIMQLSSMFFGQSQKFYHCGFVYKKNELNPDGRPLTGNDNLGHAEHSDRGGEWSKWWMELWGPVLQLWRVPDELAEIPYTYGLPADKFIAFEMDPAQDFLAAVKAAHNAPIYINVTDAMVEMLPADFKLPSSLNAARPPPLPYTSMFVMSNAGSNLFLFACVSAIHCNTWMAALRLVAFEVQKLNQLFTFKLLKRPQHVLAWEAAGVAPFESHSFRGEVRFEGPLQVRTAYSMQWKAYHVVVTSRVGLDPTASSGSSSLTKKLFGKRSSNLDFSKRGNIVFYETKADAKKGKRPVFTMDTLRSIAAIWPEKPEMIELGMVCIAKLEGTLHVPAKQLSRSGSASSTDTDQSQSGNQSLSSSMGSLSGLSQQQQQQQQQHQASSSTPNQLSSQSSLRQPTPLSLSNFENGFPSFTAPSALRDIVEGTDNRPPPPYIHILTPSTNDLAKWMTCLYAAFSLDADYDHAEAEIAEMVRASQPQPVQPAPPPPPLLPAIGADGSLVDPATLPPPPPPPPPPQAVLWPTPLFLSVAEIAGLAMLHAVPLDTNIQFAHYFAQKLMFSRQGKLRVWCESLAKGEWERRLTARREVDAKLRVLFDWVERVKTALREQGVVVPERMKAPDMYGLGDAVLDTADGDAERDAKEAKAAKAKRKAKRASKALERAAAASAAAAAGAGAGAGADQGGADGSVVSADTTVAVNTTPEVDAGQSVRFAVPGDDRPDDTQDSSQQPRDVSTAPITMATTEAAGVAAPGAAVSPAVDHAAARPGSADSDYSDDSDSDSDSESDDDDDKNAGANGKAAAMQSKDADEDSDTTDDGSVSEEENSDDGSMSDDNDSEDDQIMVPSHMMHQGYNSGVPVDYEYEESVNEFQIYGQNTLLAQMAENQQRAIDRVQAGRLVNLSDKDSLELKIEKRDALIPQLEQQLQSQVPMFQSNSLLERVGASGPRPLAQDGPLLSNIKTEERVKPRLEGGLLGEMNRREKEREYFKKLGYKATGPSGGVLPASFYPPMMMMMQGQGQGQPGMMPGMMPGMQMVPGMGMMPGMMHPGMMQGMGMMPPQGQPGMYPYGYYPPPQGMPGQPGPSGAGNRNSAQMWPGGMGYPPQGPQGMYPQYMYPYGYAMPPPDDDELPAVTQKRESVRHQWLEFERNKERQRMGERMAETMQQQQQQQQHPMMGGGMWPPQQPGGFVDPAMAQLQAKVSMASFGDASIYHRIRSGSGLPAGSHDDSSDPSNLSASNMDQGESDSESGSDSSVEDEDSEDGQRYARSGTDTASSASGMRRLDSGTESGDSGSDESDEDVPLHALAAGRGAAKASKQAGGPGNAAGFGASAAKKAKKARAATSESGTESESDDDDVPLGGRPGGDSDSDEEDDDVPLGERVPGQPTPPYPRLMRQGDSDSETSGSGRPRPPYIPPGTSSDDDDAPLAMHAGPAMSRSALPLAPTGQAALSSQQQQQMMQMQQQMSGMTGMSGMPGMPAMPTGAIWTPQQIMQMQMQVQQMQQQIQQQVQLQQQLQMQQTQQAQQMQQMQQTHQQRFVGQPGQGGRVPDGDDSDAGSESESSDAS